jgi:hypothetical protein
VKWLYFNGVSIDNINHLKWVTATEVDNWKFEIQRSLDGEQWGVVGYVLGHGTSSFQNTYVFYDKYEYPNITNIYYRLKQIDFNNNFDYSDIISIDHLSLDNGTTKYFDLLGRVVKQNSLFILTK